MNKIILIIALFIIACNNKAETDIYEFQKKIINSKILEKYKGYHVAPVTRGLDKIHIFFPDSTSIYVRGFDIDSPKKMRVVKYTNLKKQFLYGLKVNNEDTLILQKCYNLLYDLTNLNIIGIEISRRCDCILVYSNIINEKTLKKTKYVLIYDKSNNIINDSHCLYDKEDSVTEIGNNWFFYSSFLYPNYEEFN